MKISFNWLKQYIQTELPVERVCEILTDTGLEVEGLEKVESIKGGLAGLVIGEVLTMEKHLDADRLNITTVNIGEAENLQIVCGAPNVAPGQKVVVATVGTTLYPSPTESFKIKKSKIRGVESLGMICAEDEIGLGKGHDGIMVLPEDTAVGQLAKTFFKVEDDYLIEIGLTPNRADAMGHIGVARDLKAYLNVHENENLKINFPAVTALDFTGEFPINIHQNDECQRYAGAILNQVKVAPSPDWLQNKLRTIGLSPINNVVDITNFVMHEMGQPLHAFDLKKVGTEINIRFANPNEKITTLDGVERELNEADLVIANEKEAMCMAGVFGGIDSGVSDQTESIFLESAYFQPVSVRKTAKRHGLNTDSSFRFERGVDPNTVTTALARAVYLLKEITGANLVEAQDNYTNPIQDFKVSFNFGRCRTLMGANLSNESITKILNELDITIDSMTGDMAELIVPAYRVDVQREADIVEEVLRIYGFNKIELPEKLNTSVTFSTKPNKEKMYNLIADLLVANGYFEIMANSLSAAKHIEQVKSEVFSTANNVNILNPLSVELDVMRQTMLFGGLESIAHNQNRQAPNLSLFEFGKVYAKHEQDYIETEKLAIWLSGNVNKENWADVKKEQSFFTLKGIVESIFTKLGLNQQLKQQSIHNDLFEDGISLFIGKKEVGAIGWVKENVLKTFDVKQSVFYADLNWGEIVGHYFMNKINFKPLPKTQFVRRDFSLLLDKDIRFEQIETIAKKADRKILKEVGLFDVYEGKNLEKGKKSYAVNFIFQDQEETLKDKVVDKIMDKIRKGLEEELKAELR
ncbi:phenylalanine--tRNA ligase subunit beta [Putridiphycobacter roseus]|uniref:Phenylalanine--tRNA ligase beta subunit n=1 Tax=Putridiphycobacter roseus TaxID=2219161 RepID=A0A2W1MZB8_9FLAO|nr:phenylalanine--tRNA ligase subunit beta [Putridiphycobacter roseus]PZE17257.1 phenylalanine--tRNA ligase subunit beta [Putridiphycobacter roseus]